MEAHQFPQNIKVNKVFFGKAKEFQTGPTTIQSAIDQEERNVLVVKKDIIEGNQTISIRHGGPNRVILHYDETHYDTWIDISPNSNRDSFKAGGFGENISTRGIREQDVCIGDVIEIGECTLQVTQPRRPCYKLNYRFHDAKKKIPVLAEENARTGWFYKVLIEGQIKPGDSIKLISRDYPDYSIAYVTNKIWVEKNPIDRETLQKFLKLPDLDKTWLDVIEKRLRTGKLESVNERYFGKEVQYYQEDCIAQDPNGNFSRKIVLGSFILLTSLLILKKYQFIN